MSRGPRYNRGRWKSGWKPLSSGCSPPKRRFRSCPRRQIITQFRVTTDTPLSVPPKPDANPPTHLWPRWIFLRALGLIYFSAFYSLLFQIKGLIGPAGILPAADYLQAVSGALHSQRFWFAPTLFWMGASDHALMLACWVGLAASLLLFLNVWPRAMLLISFVCFLSFVSAAQDFSGYQSDGMLLEAGFLCLFFAPPGFWPGLGSAIRLRAPVSSCFDGNGSASTSGQAWPKWPAATDPGATLQPWTTTTRTVRCPPGSAGTSQHFPHWFHASAVFYTLAIELVLCWMLFLPRRFRVILFFIVAPFEISIILTANYAFLNYIVFSLGFLLLR